MVSMESNIISHDAGNPTAVNPETGNLSGANLVEAKSGSLSQPVAGADRIEALDIVRGFALFGVLMLNMLDFSGPVNAFEPWAVSVDWWDRLVELSIRVFGEAAFYTTFSFLFGLGFAMQFERAMARGQRFGLRFMTRLTVLAVFGFLHATFIWDGDILFQYAITGFFLLLFAKTSPRGALHWAAGFAGFAVTALGAILGIAVLTDFEFATAADIAENISFLSESGFGDIASSRLDDLLENVIVTFVGVPWFLSLFLVGLWAVRTGKLANWRNEGEFLRSVLRVSIPIAVAAKGLLALLIVFEAVELSATAGIVLSVFIGGPALGATYVCLLLLALQRAANGQHLLRHLAPVGRMALTNYLMQSVVAVLFFYGYGLGYYGRFGVATTFGFTVAFFAFQMVFSRLWLSRFSYGPMEWVWRTLTYRARITGDSGVVNQA